jgi:hypothetical protein
VEDAEEAMLGDGVEGCRELRELEATGEGGDAYGVPVDFTLRDGGVGTSMED